MAAQMFRVATGLPGQLWIMPCPDGQKLTSDIATFRAAGVDRVVSMLGKDEASALGLASEGQLCEAAGISFENVPIVDFGLPEPEAFVTLIHQIRHWLEVGQNVAVHCRAGIGRSGMVTAGVLIAAGQAPDMAIQNVSAARGVSIPDTVEQGEFLTACAEKL